MAVDEKSAVDRPCGWQDPDAYGWVMDLPRLGWAWEFLRRDPEYRSAWRRSGSGPVRWALCHFRPARIRCPFRRTVLAAGRVPRRADRLIRRLGGYWCPFPLPDALHPRR